MPKTKPTEMPGYLSHTGDTTPPPRPTLAELAECLKVWGEMGIGIAKAKPIKSTRGVERKPLSRRVPFSSSKSHGGREYQGSRAKATIRECASMPERKPRKARVPFARSESHNVGEYQMIGAKAKVSESTK